VQAVIGLAFELDSQRQGSVLGVVEQFLRRLLCELLWRQLAIGMIHYEYMRQRAQELQQRNKPQPTKTVWAIGSMEWLAEQKEAG
jgi:hypothetical protein